MSFKAYSILLLYCGLCGNPLYIHSYGTVGLDGLNTSGTLWKSIYIHPGTRYSGIHLNVRYFESKFGQVWERETQIVFVHFADMAY